jgi:4-aminobutyrate--pyruvate transaminase
MALNDKRLFGQYPIGNRPDSGQCMTTSLRQRDLQHLLHPTTDMARLEARGPLVADHGDGIYLYDENGKQYIEGLSIAWCLSLGYGEEELVTAAATQMRRLAHAGGFFGRSSEPVVELAEKIKQWAPFDVSKVFFVNSGSEANDTQIKLIWCYFNAIGRPSKKKIIARRRGYHGVTVATTSLTGLDPFHVDWDMPLPGFLHTDCPHHYRYAEPGETEAQFADRLAESLDRLIESEGPDTVAAFIAEPVIGAGGVLFPPESYFDKVQAVLKRHDVLFVADEVICGFCRLGDPFGCDSYGIRPDTMTVAKQLSSAYLPIAAVLIPEFMYEAIAEHTRGRGVFAHGYTYGSHPVCAAVALRTLQLYEERHILEHVRRVAPHFETRVARLAGHPLVGEARSRGLLGAVELVADKASKRAFRPEQKVGTYCEDRAFEHGLVGRAIGDRMAFCPPLIISEAQIDEMFDRFTAALDDTQGWLESQR